MGNYIFNSLQENVLECAGAVGLGALGDWALSQAMEEVGSSMGFMIGGASSLAVGLMIGKMTCSYVANTQDSKILKVSKVALGCTVVTLSTMLLPNAGRQTGAIIGHTLGSLVGAQGGAILGGYAAIKLNGSDEILIDKTCLLNSYAIKSLQSSYVCSIFSRFISSDTFFQAIQDQAIGSLAYHSLTIIKPTLESIHEGSLLDETLLNSPVLTPEEKELFRKGVKNFYKNPSHRQALLAYAISQGIQEDILLPFFQQYAKDLFNQFYNLQTQMSPVNEQQFMGILIRSFNEYFNFIFKNPSILEAQQKFNQLFLSWKGPPSELLNSQAFKQCQMNCLAVLETETIEFFKDHPFKEILKGQQINSDEQKVKQAINELMTKIKNLEEKTFAFPLTNHFLELYVENLTQIHLNSFKYFLIAEGMKPLQEIDANAMRKNYQHCTELLASYYVVGINARLPMGVAFISKQVLKLTKTLLYKQIHTAKLRDCSLGEFIDLKPVVKSLKIP
jgi:hypothetical protein